ncbi:hypothetical protein [Paenibacillus graminis]|uniref:hypothetical protein n=1 Tax=Paenibacillus graminis TaxID=189425 RepID=UPI000F97B07E|nr:hypothetical protein [Paenibacillus graminis]MEC0173130.1 hypothetical protein [Paenibacillus graminis]
MTNEAELRKEISSIVHKILILIRKDRIIPNREISMLIDYLDEIKIFTKGRDDISKKLVYELFYLYTTVISQISYNKEDDISIVTELYMRITSVFNDGLYQ